MDIVDGKKIEFRSNVLLASIESMQYAVTLVTHMNGLTRFPLSLSTIQRNHSQENGLGRINEERRDYE
ncbi:hypothetical protein L6452_03229 [Arctium lappa]|uniref:Uncharacterized protein n=1 Tax=Arctium lappa TaxID=4217 RepID=A0ACB9FMI5_ARCLA|nr:hypothetical protein L6452_03229 [Arctium lappa]